jgi:hypothetical protein
VKHLAVAFQNSGELLIKDLGIKFTGDTEAGWIVQYRIEEAARLPCDVLRYISVRQRQSGAHDRAFQVIGRPGVEAS